MTDGGLGGPPAMPQAARPYSLPILASLLLGGALALQVAWIDDPLRFNLGDVGGALYAGSFARHFEESGFWPVAGRPTLNVVPLSEESLGEAYLMHPPLTYWATTLSCGLLGRTPFALRLPGLIALLIALASLAGITRAAWGRMGSLIAPAICALTAQLLLNGTTPHNQPYLLAAILATWWAVLALAARPGWWRAAGLLLAALGGCFADWQYALYAPLFLAVALTAPGRRLPAVGALGIAGTLGAAALLAWLHAVLPGELRVTGDLLEPLRAVADLVWSKRQLQGASEGPVWGRILRHQVELFPWSLLLLAALGLGLAAKALRRDPGSRGMAAAELLFAGAVIAELILVPQHAALHDYWTVPAAALAALLATRVLLHPRVPSWALAVLLSIIAAEGVTQAISQRDAVTGFPFAAVVREVGARTPEDALILGYHEALPPLRVLGDRHVLVRRISTEELALFRTWARSGILRTRSIYYLVAPGAISPEGIAILDDSAILDALRGLPEERFTLPWCGHPLTWRLVRLFP